VYFSLNCVIDSSRMRLRFRWSTLFDRGIEFSWSVPGTELTTVDRHQQCNDPRGSTEPSDDGVAGDFGRDRRDVASYGWHAPTSSQDLLATGELRSGTDVSADPCIKWFVMRLNRFEATKSTSHLAD
jgi:hypothetical protein